MNANYKITKRKRGNLRLVKIKYNHRDHVDWWTTGSDEEIKQKMTKFESRLEDRDTPKFSISDDIV